MDVRTARQAIGQALARLLGVCDGAVRRDNVGLSGADQWLRSLDSDGDDVARVAKAASALWKYTNTQIPDLRDELREAIDVLAAACKTVAVSAVGSGFSVSFPYNPVTTTILKSAVDAARGKRRWDGGLKVWRLDRVGVKALCEAVEAAGYFVQMSDETTSKLNEEAFTTLATPEVEGRYSVSNGKLTVQTPYHKDAVVAIKAAANGQARFDKASKSWTVPVACGLVLASSLSPLFPVLAAAIAADEAVQAAGQERQARAALSVACSAEAGAERGAAGVVDSVITKLDAALSTGLKLYPFQQAGVAFIEAAGGRALVGDEMGLGKTVQALGWLAIHPEARPALIVVPASLRLNWQREAEKWIPGVRVHVVRNGKDPLPANPDVVIVNYDVCARRKAELEALNAKVVVLDECHYIKNQMAQRSKAIVGVQERKTRDGAVKVKGAPGIATLAPYVIALSGTPLLNRPAELYTNLHLLRPTEYANFFAFAKRYCAAEQTRFGWDFSGASNEAELAGRLRDLMVRREKSQVLQDLPEKTRSYIHVELSNKDEYESREQEILGRLEERYGEAVGGEILAMLNELRMLAGQGKVDAAIEWIKNAVDTGKPVVVFAHHLDVLDKIQSSLQADGIKTCRIDGSIPSPEARQAAVDDFQAGRADVFLGTPGAAGVGLTLTKASDVLFVEREWTPAVEEQAEDRTHRIGQRDAVTAWYLVGNCSIDQKFADLVEQKRSIVSAVLTGKEIESSLVRDLVGKLLEGRATTEAA